MLAADLSDQADFARDRQDWTTAAKLYGESLSLAKSNAPIHLQHGHALKEAGRMSEAADAYRTAARLAPNDPEPWLHLAHLQKILGARLASIAAFREVLRRNPGSVEARNELIDAGAREQIPDSLYGQAAAALEAARLARLLTHATTCLGEGGNKSAFPLTTYHAFREQYPIQPPPGGVNCTIAILINAFEASPAELRRTLTSLLDQRHLDWTAFVLPALPLADHSIGSFTQVDPRIRFGMTPEDRTGQPVVLLSAGSVLDREALGWLAYALQRTGATAVYCDHDHYAEDWRGGVAFHSPRLQTMFDPDGMTASSDPPAAAIFKNGLNDLSLTVLSGLIEASEGGIIAHLPRLLVSLPAPRAVDDAPRASFQKPAESAARIAVIIPTRDEAEMLERSIRTLRETARCPELLSFVVVDNRSVEANTFATLERLQKVDSIKCLRLDEPFNWSRCNNLAARSRDEEILVFANNDTEMITSDWDESIRRLLARPDIGVLGARLLYPGGGVQHAGILLGGWQGRPSHDGLWATDTEPGPLNRWTSVRAAAAVTGAFLACRRETFDAVNGFDERLAIAYNDIDFCLRARQVGLKVMFSGQIELAHHESRTRGQNNSSEKVDWDKAELADLHDRWGRWLFHDPSYNPQWVGAVNRPYDGVRDLPISQVLTHLDASAIAKPWGIGLD